MARLTRQRQKTVGCWESVRAVEGTLSGVDRKGPFNESSIFSYINTTLCSHSDLLILCPSHHKCKK